MPDLTAIKSGQTPVPFSPTLRGQAGQLSLEAYLDSLDVARSLMRERLNVHIAFVPQDFAGLELIIKKDLGIVLSRWMEEEITFFIDVPQVLDAVWAFAEDQGQRLVQGKRRDSLRALDILAESLRS